MEDTRISRHDVRASIWFLEDSEVYAAVKPYSLAFIPEAQIPRENIERKEVSVSISDLRDSGQLFSLDRNGFTVLEFQDKDDEVDWDNKERVSDMHYPKVVSEIERAIPGARCIVLHHIIRKRHPLFPNSTGKDYTYGQPLRAAHVDMVRSSAEQLVQERLGGQASALLKGNYIVANVWHPLKGPNQDWPLALCDAATLDPERDLEVADYVTETTNREHCLVYRRNTHRWWYLSHQKITEAFLFRQYDSRKGTTSGVPHASFLNPYCLRGEPRESVEVVVVIYWP